MVVVEVAERVQFSKSIELHRVASEGRWQGGLECFGVSRAGGLQYGGLGLQALQLGIDKLQALQLRFGLIREAVGVPPAKLHELKADFV
jgi:hypothetical protein